MDRQKAVSKKRAKAPKRFSYCIGRPFPKSPTNPSGQAICVYAFGDSVHYGTYEEAASLRKHLTQITGRRQYVYRLTRA